LSRNRPDRQTRIESDLGVDRLAPRAQLGVETRTDRTDADGAVQGLTTLVTSSLIWGGRSNNRPQPPHALVVEIDDPAQQSQVTGLERWGYRTSIRASREEKKPVHREAPAVTGGAGLRFGT